jgi:hypothetical protein
MEDTGRTSCALQDRQRIPKVWHRHLQARSEWEDAPAQEQQSTLQNRGESTQEATPVSDRPEAHAKRELLAQPELTA